MASEGPSPPPGDRPGDRPGEAASGPGAKKPARRGIRSLTPMLLTLTAALLALALLLLHTLQAERSARAQALDETARMAALQQVLQSVTDAETSQRGYLLTGQADFLVPFRAARAQIGGRLAGLARLNRGIEDRDGRTGALMGELEGHIAAKLTELERTVDLTAAGRRDEALARVRTGIGRRMMARVREVTGEMVEEENRRRAAAFAQVAATERRVVWLVAVLVLAIVALVLVGFRAERARAAVAAAAEQAEALRDANARALLLARELNHRVKNLFSIILAIVSLSGRKQAPVREVVEDIRARIQALSLAHTVSQGAISDAAVDLAEVITRTMEPYADRGGSRIRIDGPARTLAVRAVTPVGLIVHELATNAIKYGALSSPEGEVAITWDVTDLAVPDGGHAREAVRNVIEAKENTAEVRSESHIAPQLHLRWIETGGPTLSPTQIASVTSGYGSQMIALAASQLGGRINKEWAATGLIVDLSFPLPPIAGEASRAA